MIMSKFKKMYRDFFGLNEISSAEASELNAVLPDLTKNMEDLAKAKKELTAEEFIDEAQLVNNLTDYAGHVIYQLWAFS